MSQFAAYEPGLRAGVRVAVGDFTGDSVPDVATGPGPGGRPEVRVFDGATGGLVSSATAFDPSFLGGVFVAAGDFDADGRADLVVTPDEGGGPRVQVLSGRDGSVIANVFGIDDPPFRGGARPAVGDVNGDGADDLIISAGFGGGPRVAVFDGRTVRPGAAPGRLCGDFFAFEPGLRNGAYAAAGDLNRDGRADLVFGAGPGGGPRVLAVSGRELAERGGAEFAVLGNFFAGDAGARGGVRVAVADADSDGIVDVIAGGGAGDHYLRVYGGPGLAPILDALPYGRGPTGGLFVAGEALPVRPVPTRLALRSERLPGSGVSLSLTATVSATGAAPPLGSVTFFDGDVAIGSAPLSAVGGVSEAVLVTGQLSEGPHAIRATYAGGRRHLLSDQYASQVLSFVVAPGGPGTLGLTRYAMFPVRGASGRGDEVPGGDDGGQPGGRGRHPDRPCQGVRPAAADGRLAAGHHRLQRG